jgi:hypothetical protein
VSPFAAGCAVCGTDLDVHRWDAGPSVANRIGSWFGALGAGHSYSGPWVWIAILAFFAFGGSVVAWLSGAL